MNAFGTFPLLKGTFANLKNDVALFVQIIVEDEVGGVQKWQNVFPARVIGYNRSMISQGLILYRRVRIFFRTLDELFSGVEAA